MPFSQFGPRNVADSQFPSPNDDSELSAVLDRILAESFKNTGVMAGKDNEFDLTYGSGMTWNVNSGQCRKDGTRYTKAADTVTVTADGTNPRWCLIVYDTAGAGDIESKNGTPSATNPTIPEPDADQVPLWAVYVPAGATSFPVAPITPALDHALDMRVMLRDPGILYAHEFPGATDDVRIQAALDTLTSGSTVWLVDGKGSHASGVYQFANTVNVPDFDDVWIAGVEGGRGVACQPTTTTSMNDKPFFRFMGVTNEAGTTTTEALDTTETGIDVTSDAAFAAGRPAIIEPNTANEEIVWVVSKAANVLTVLRGKGHTGDGTTGIAHNSGASIVPYDSYRVGGGVKCLQFVGFAVGTANYAQCDGVHLSMRLRTTIKDCYFSNIREGTATDIEASGEMVVSNTFWNGCGSQIKNEPCIWIRDRIGDGDGYTSSPNIQFVGCSSELSINSHLRLQDGSRKITWHGGLLHGVHASSFWNSVTQSATDLAQGATSLVLTTGHGAFFPATADLTDGVNPLFILIDEEIMRVTARSGDTLTVVRGCFGTADVAHTTDGGIVYPANPGVWINDATFAPSDIRFVEVDWSTHAGPGIVLGSCSRVRVVGGHIAGGNNTPPILAQLGLVAGDNAGVSTATATDVEASFSTSQASVVAVRITNTTRGRLVGGTHDNTGTDIDISSGGVLYVSPEVRFVTAPHIKAVGAATITGVIPAYESPPIDLTALSLNQEWAGFRDDFRYCAIPDVSLWDNSGSNTFVIGAGGPLLRLTTTSTSGNVAFCHKMASIANNVAGRRCFFTLVVKPNHDTSNDIRCGLFATEAEAEAGTDATNGVYFRKDSGGNWTAVCREGGVETAVDVEALMGSPSDTATVVLRAILDDDDSVEFWGGTSTTGVRYLTTISTNVPSSGIWHVGVSIETLTTAARTLDMTHAEGWMRTVLG